VGLLTISTLAILAMYYGWRYSKTSVDPDWAMFNLYSFTGSLYGRDFADCKSPGVHLWYMFLGWIAGVRKLESRKAIERVKFLHHTFLGIGCIIFYLVSSQPLSALILLVLVESGWLLAFHGNVSDVPTVLVAIALVTPAPWIAFWIMAAAVFYEPKLLFAFGVLIVIKGWWLFTLLLLCWAGLIWLFCRKEDWFKWIWESSWTIPKRMDVVRRKEKLYDWMPFFTSKGFMYILPWVFLGVIFSGQPWWYWIPMCVYLITLGMGYAIRENHLIPLAAWLAVGWQGTAILPALALIWTDWISAGFYLGDIWMRHYQGLKERNAEARRVGEWLKGKAGALWVNELHSAVYIYARKPVPFGLCEQIEIREVAHERRNRMKIYFKMQPPEWVVCGLSAAITFRANGYRLAHEDGSMTVFEKV